LFPVLFNLGLEYTSVSLKITDSVLVNFKLVDHRAGDIDGVVMVRLNLIVDIDVVG
jgi:hypothetical protein